MKPFKLLPLIIVLLIGAPTAWGYPLDGYPSTGIIRLEGFRLAQNGTVRGRQLPAGALLNLERVDLRMPDQAGFQIPPADPRFAVKVKKLLGNEANRYAITLMDLSDPENPLYVEHRGDYKANAGSVGKLIVVLGIFQALADIYPDDIEARQKVLRDTVVTADSFIISDHHKAPFWELNGPKILYRPIQKGDRASLWTYLDWMLSASSNAAASMVMRELMLLVQFGSEYPVSPEAGRRFFRESPKKELKALLVKALQEPITRNGLDIKQLRQGSFFTRNGKQMVPGTTSYATPRELMRFLIKMEQGRLVDVFSSREIKRLIYMTQRRIRYASSPALSPAAVYFKSGSLYKCKPEPDFKCRKYHGNVINMLNSVAIVEHPAGNRQLFYMVVVMSNVLRKNSAVAHQTLATRIHRLIERHYQERKSIEVKDRSQK
jgi:hypothetical protein